MQSVLNIDDAAQAAALLQPLRTELVKLMAEPRSCPELAGKLGIATQKVNYHVRKLTEAGLVEKVRERKVRGILEGIYRARAASYWLSPRLVRQAGGQRGARSEVSLGYLLNLAEELQDDITNLAQRADENPVSLGLSAEIELSDPDRRSEFLADVKKVFERLAARYGAASTRQEQRPERFRLRLACYENPERAGNSQKRSKP